MWQRANAKGRTSQTTTSKTNLKKRAVLPSAKANWACCGDGPFGTRRKEGKINLCVDVFCPYLLCLWRIGLLLLKFWFWANAWHAPTASIKGRTSRFVFFGAGHCLQCRPTFGFGVPQWCLPRALPCDSLCCSRQFFIEKRKILPSRLSSDFCFMAPTSESGPKRLPSFGSKRKGTWIWAVPDWFVPCALP